MGDSIEWIEKSSDEAACLCGGFKLRGQTFMKEQQLQFQFESSEGGLQCFAEIREVISDGTLHLRIYFPPANTPMGMARPTIFGEVCVCSIPSDVQDEVVSLARELSMTCEEFMANLPPHTGHPRLKIVSYYEYCRIKADQKFKMVNGLAVDTAPLLYCRRGCRF